MKDGNLEETKGLGARALKLAPGVSVILTLDQLTKALVAARFAPGQSIAILPGLLHLTLVHNAGMAFGLFSGFDFPFKPELVTLVRLAVLALVIYLALRSPREESMTHLGLTFILGGALGNIIDTARQGYVVDFIDVFYRDLHWPAFNLADSCICIGVGLMLLDNLRRHQPAIGRQPEVAGGSGTGDP